MVLRVLSSHPRFMLCALLSHPHFMSRVLLSHPRFMLHALSSHLHFVLQVLSLHSRGGRHVAVTFVAWLWWVLLCHVVLQSRWVCHATCRSHGCCAAWWCHCTAWCCICGYHRCGWWLGHGRPWRERMTVCPSAIRMVSEEVGRKKKNTLKE
jgi:hypothetical protein